MRMALLDVRDPVDPPAERTSSVRPVEIETIVAAARDIRPVGVLVELGTWAGGTAEELAARLPDWSIVTIDSYPRSVHCEKFAAKGVRWAQDQVAGVLKRRKNISQVISDTATVGARWAGPPVDILLVDSDHRAKHVVRELRAWTPHMDRRGRVCFHDYFYLPDAGDWHPGVHEAAEYVLPPRGWVRVPQFEAESLSTWERQDRRDA